jgi:hypothetical protein
LGEPRFHPITAQQAAKRGTRIRLTHGIAHIFGLSTLTCYSKAEALDLRPPQPRLPVKS